MLPQLHVYVPPQHGPVVVAVEKFAGTKFPPWFINIPITLDIQKFVIPGETNVSIPKRPSQHW